MIYFDKVSKIYADKCVALEDVSFAVEPGEFVSVVGHSGAGKTTLLKLLWAEEHPSSGDVFFESKNIKDITKKDLYKHRRKIGVIFQNFRLLPHKTAYENIAFAMEAAGAEPDEIKADVPQVLELVGLTSRSWHFPHELSGGERQRIGIARAIVNQPDVILADEPTGNLDPLCSWEIISILKKINDLGTTVILSTHNKSAIDKLGKRVITMKDGKITRDDKSGRYVV
jgi:cell division transport system ATP-binding protein